jgi:hypothetical protein
LVCLCVLRPGRWLDGPLVGITHRRARLGRCIFHALFNIQTRCTVRGGEPLLLTKFAHKPGAVCRSAPESVAPLVIIQHKQALTIAVHGAPIKEIYNAYSLER